MTTLVFSALGAALGGAVGGSVLGLSSVAIGRFAGSLIGNAIDQRLLGSGSGTVKMGRIDRYRFTGSAEGRPVAQLYGRMRIGGHVIWATEFLETVTTTGGGKGMPSRPKQETYSYSVSLAIGLCEGEITGVTRVWADGREIALQDLSMRVYTGSEDQLPDPKMEAVEGAGTVPAYRGLAYVVFEDLELAAFGNRVPQFSFEVSRPSPATQSEADTEPTYATRAVALIPGTGEYALATEPVYKDLGPGQKVAVNMNVPSGAPDFVTASDALQSELPNCGSASLIVGWFGTDLRCGNCEIHPRVEQVETDGSMPWRVAGLTRATAGTVPVQDGRPVYGGTCSDQSVIQAIQHLKEQGKSVMYYPFILMEQMADNGLPDPWSDAADQPVLPWRGRITSSVAPSVAGSPDGTAAAESEVSDFFGTASAADFNISGSDVSYSGPAEWRYRRFILHQAALCKAAGGVDAFCIGSEMRGLTWIRSAGGQFVAVQALIDLLKEVRALLGAEVKLSYAADWSEYFGYQPQDGSGDRYFHLDALWADEDIDFIGIDNYMPLSDWRDQDGHADAGYGAIYNLDYLTANVEGGEGYDWYYHSDEARAAQIRTPIEDGAFNEPWIYRYKDIRNWWLNEHHDRIGGERQSTPTAWEPQSKPIVFTELGCAAVDKATNQPNKFVDPKSYESRLPYFSSGRPDEYIQHQYLKAQYRHWGQAENNPISVVYGGPMVDMEHAYVWAWDMRPFPRFPRNTELWGDGDNYRLGHWISGRVTHRSLASVVREICERAGVAQFDVSGLEGMVRGFGVDQVGESRQSLQPLMLRYGFDAVERGGVLTFVMRGAGEIMDLNQDALAVTAEMPMGLEQQRMSEAETIGRVRINAVEAMGEYDSLAEEAILSDQPTLSVSSNELNLTILRGEARQVTERWLAEAQLAKDTVQFALPLSQLGMDVGQVVALTDDDGAEQFYRIDRRDVAEAIQCVATRVSKDAHLPSDVSLQEAGLPEFASPVPMEPLFLDLPLIRGDELAHAPHVVAVADPWPGAAAVYQALVSEDFTLAKLLSQRPTVGILQNDLAPVGSGVWDRSDPVEVKMITGQLQSVSEETVLQGGNVAVIGDGTPGNWEVIQFATADLVAEKTYAIRTRLRGQSGSDGGNLAWPAGAWFVLLDDTVEQMDLPLSSMGLSRRYRVGPAARPVSDTVYTELNLAFAGNGLRPYAPAHLRAEMQTNGTVSTSWIRRSRIGADSWELPEIPLGEETEAYQLEVLSAGTSVDRFTLREPRWEMSSAYISSHALSGVVELRVAQISALYGVGHQASVQVALS